MIEEIYARCPKMFAVGSDRAEEDWFAARAHKHERHKFTMFPSIEVLANFRNYKIGGIGLEIVDFLLNTSRAATFEKIRVTNFSRDDLKLVLAQEMRSAKAILKSVQGAVSNRGYSKKFHEVFQGNMVDIPHNGGIFGTIKVFERKILTSAFAIRTAHRAAVAAELYNKQNIKPPRTVLELGGGFGKSLADLFQTYPGITALYVDLPMNMAIAAHYFDSRFPNRVNLVWETTGTIRHGMINVVAPWLINRIDFEVDLMINLLSLQHMPQRTIEYYFAELISARVRYLYHENRLAPRETQEGEGYLGTLSKRLEMDIRHSIELPLRTPQIFSEFIRNPRVP